MITVLITNCEPFSFQDVDREHMKRHPALLLAALVAVALLPAACGGTADDGTLTVVATTTILGDVVKNVVGSDGEVVVLTPVGADPHDFRASATQVAAINRADLVVANGLLLEEGLADVLDAARGDGVRVLEIGPLVDPLPFGDAAGDIADEGSRDPHVWLDPIRMAEASRLIANTLAEVAPSIDWSPRTTAYAAELEATDVAIAATLSTIDAGNRRLVTNHDSLGYFADRYDFDIIGVVIPGGSTLGNPSSQELADLVEVIRREGVRVIFGETTQPSVLAEAVAAELGESVTVVSLYTGSLGEPGSGAETLIGMMTTNARRIAEALGG